MKRTLYILFALLLPLLAGAQPDRQHIRRGNRNMNHEAYQDAVLEYMKALEADSTRSLTHYNMGVAWYHNNKPDSAKTEYAKAILTETNPQYVAEACHNMGVLFQQAALDQDEARKDSLLQTAILYYRRALRNDPHNDETRYNYLLCLRQLKPKDQQGDGGGEGDDENKNDQSKDDKQKQDDSQEQKDNKQKQEQSEEKKDDSKQQEPPKPEISEANAEQLLKAAMQNEQQTQDKMNQMRSARRRLQKQW